MRRGTTAQQRQALGIGDHGGGIKGIFDLLDEDLPVSPRGRHRPGEQPAGGLALRF